MDFKQILREKMALSQSQNDSGSSKIASEFPLSDTLSHLITYQLGHIFQWRSSRYSAPKTQKKSRERKPVSIKTIAIEWSKLTGAEVTAALHIGLPQGKSFTEIELKRIYRKGALELHPDLNPSLPSSKFRDFHTAYKNLLKAMHRSGSEVTVSGDNVSGLG